MRRRVHLKSMVQGRLERMLRSPPISSLARYRAGHYPADMGTNPVLQRALLGLAYIPSLAPVVDERPNIVLVMTDDQGWGDTGYAGHARLETPALDRMAAEGLRFERFYAAAPVCSPTRASVLTGRHPSRMGIDGANSGHLPDEELTLAEVCLGLGYTTGHFGKWHLGTLTRELEDSNRGGRAAHSAHYSPPWQHGFRVCFSTEAKVPTWDPMIDPGSAQPYGTRYWNEHGEVVTEDLGGDDSRVIMDRAVHFIAAAAREETPFLAVIWLHSPHRPVIAGPAYLERYEDVERDDLRHYYGCLSAVDDQVGRLRDELARLEVAEDTLLWFTSDNGPEGPAAGGQGSSGGLRGRKRSLYEGGVRVPGILVWPARVREPRTSQRAASTLDFFPTLLELLGVPLDSGPGPLDGSSLLGEMLGTGDPAPAARLMFHSRGAGSVQRADLKLIRTKASQAWQLYDLAADPTEQRDLAAHRPAQVGELARLYEQWWDSVQASRSGADYPEDEPGKGRDKRPLSP